MDFRTKLGITLAIALMALAGLLLNISKETFSAKAQFVKTFPVMGTIGEFVWYDNISESSIIIYASLFLLDIFLKVNRCKCPLKLI